MLHNITHIVPHNLSFFLVETFLEAIWTRSSSIFDFRFMLIVVFWLNLTVSLSSWYDFNKVWIIGTELAHVEHKSPWFTLRRWACYPMLLGRVICNFKHCDASRCQKHFDTLWPIYSHGKKTQSTQCAILPAIIIGSARGVRRLSNAVMVEIVCAATQHRTKKNSVSESGVLSQLASNKFLLRSKNV